LNPNDGESCRRLALACQAQRKWQDAEACYRKLLAEDASNLDVLVNLGFVLTKQERLDEAVTVYRQILAIRPDYHEVHNNLAFIDERRGRFQDAIDAARRAVAIRPDYAAGFNNWGTALRSLHRLDEACDCFQTAMDLDSGCALAEFNFATTRMLQGRLRDGWRGYERRVEAVGLISRQFSQPRWNGTAIPGLRLFVHSDQGFGDAIQFVRFLKRVKQQSAAQLILECQPELMTLLQGQTGADALVSSEAPAADFDFEIPLSSLPGLFQIDVDDIPADVPYLQANVPLRPELFKRINESATEGRKVGIVWRGNPEQARDVVRSCPLDKFARLAEVGGVTIFSLQTGIAAAKELSARCPVPVIDLGPDLHNFADTAAAIRALDLVITVDTAVAHLAGALGHPVWTLLPHTPDWRWRLDRSDSPWYPSMRLFRQPNWGNWDAVLEKVWNDLQ
jgi:tetratricopeptide (TPR) repeat protein